MGSVSSDLISVKWVSVTIAVQGTVRSSNLHSCCGTKPFSFPCRMTVDIIILGCDYLPVSSLFSTDLQPKGRLHQILLHLTLILRNRLQLNSE